MNVERRRKGERETERERGIEREKRSCLNGHVDFLSWFTGMGSYRHNFQMLYLKAYIPGLTFISLATTNSTHSL